MKSRIEGENGFYSELKYGNYQYDIYDGRNTYVAFVHAHTFTFVTLYRHTIESVSSIIELADECQQELKKNHNI